VTVYGGTGRALVIRLKHGRRPGTGWIPDLLVRVRPPGDPHGSRRERAEAAREAWTLRRPGRVSGRDVLLVDDVVTTGATVSEASRLLIRAGARQVDVLALARVD
jgi:predicted amidophosphoribosyltransferase